jgi:hypothetical protein
VRVDDHQSASVSRPKPDILSDNALGVAGLSRTGLAENHHVFKPMVVSQNDRLAVFR